MRITAFIVGAILVDVALHWYFWVRLFRDPAWPAPVKVTGAVVLILLAAALPVVRWLGRSWPHDSMQPLEVALFVWMGAAFFLFTALVALDLARALITGFTLATAWIHGGAAAQLPLDPERRRVLAGAAAVAAGGASALALRSGLAEVEVREVGVRLARLPKALDGLRIVQLTDVHVGQSTIGTRFVEQIVAKANAARPDVIVITGDLVDGEVSMLADETAALAKLSARYGVYFVTGNHEYYSGVDAWTAHLRKMGIRVLRNERAVIGDEGASIDLAGVDDFSGARWSGSTAGGPDLGRALAGRDPDRGLILLAHQPKAIEEAAQSGVELQLSGHTHGGQLWPFSYLVGLTQPYLSGLHRHAEGTQIYVSSGTGHWGPPMRLLAPAEITKIVLGAG